MAKNIQKNMKIFESYETLVYAVVMLSMIGIVIVSVLQAGGFI